MSQHVSSKEIVIWQFFFIYTSENRDNKCKQEPGKCNNRLLGLFDVIETSMDTISDPWYGRTNPGK